jgi:hypothetical protein
MKFNIVLIPNSDEIASTLIDLANKISIKNNLNPEYLIRDIESKSIPHASVIQFELKEDSPLSGFFIQKNNNLLRLIWQHVSEIWQSILSDKNNRELICSLPKNINYKHDTAGSFTGISWAEIVINKKENPMVQQFHDKLREKLTPLGIKCLNASGERYNPHFTLFNIRTSLLEKVSLIKEIPESYMHTLRSFSLRPALGIANNSWELTTKIYQEEIVRLTKKKVYSRL